jgi:site-specific DNA recombinase
MDTHSAQADRFRRGNLPFGDVAGQGREWQSQFLSGLASRVAIHMEQVYHIDIALVKYWIGDVHSCCVPCEVTVMRAVIYCRVSTDRQVRHGDSLETQKASCLAYCKQHGYEVADIFMEEGESAQTLDRTQLQKLIDYCQKNKGKVQVMVVNSISRFSRETLDHKTLRVVLYGHGVTLRSVTEPIDDTAEGEFMEHIISGVAQYENRQRARRTVAGMKNKQEKGGWCFKTPLGYRNTIDVDERRTVSTVPEDAALIQQAFEMYATGLHTKQAVLKKVNNLGLKARSGKPVPDQSFDRMLRNPFYAGFIAVTGNKVKDWPEMTKGNHEALISRETFQKVQDILAGRQVTIAPRQRYSPEFPLRNFVRCGACDSPLTGSFSTGRNKKKYPHYYCQNDECKAAPRNIKREQLEGHFVEFLRRIQPNSDYLRLYRAILTDVWQKKQTEAYERLRAAESKVTELRERKRKLHEALVYQKVISHEDYLEMKADLESELALGEIEQREARSVELDVEAVINFAESVLTDAARLWQEMKPDQQQRFQKVLFPKGVQYSAGVYRTAQTCIMFNDLQPEELQNPQLVALPGIEPGF